MPYQDVDEIEVVETTRSPTVFGRWLRKIFVEDWGIKLVALGISLFLWLAVTDLNRPRRIRTAVQLNFIRPDNLNISNDPPKTVDVELTGSRERLNSMRLLDLVATVDLRDNRAGERVIRLSTDRVHMELPAGVKIESFKPATISIRLEANVERQLPVEIKLEGQPAPGYEIYRSTAQPGTVSVRGPASLIEGLNKAPTEIISIEGRRESFTAVRVTIDISDQRIELLNQAVDVAIEISEKKPPAAAPVSLVPGLAGSLVAKATNYSARSTRPNSK